MSIFYRISLYFAAAMSALSSVSCRNTQEGNRDNMPEEVDKVMILYSAGFNNLSSYLESDIEDMTKGYLPSKGGKTDVLLIFSKLAKGYNYSVQTAPSLVRLYKNYKGEVATDTLWKMPEGTIAASAKTLRKVLSFISSRYVARSYGLVLSSHGTGWLPQGYFSNPEAFEGGSVGGFSVAGVRPEGNPVLYHEPPHAEGMPPVKTMLQETGMVSGVKFSYEPGIEDLAAAIPMPLDYIIMDACFMGGIETAYALRNVCDVFAASQAEVIAEGFDYTALAKRLLQGETPDVAGVCDDFYQYYINQTGTYRSATISLIDCNRLAPLTNVCSALFEKYRGTIKTMGADGIQQFFRFSRQTWFYDLYDIMAHAGASAEELSKLQSALDQCVVYKAATPRFMDTFDIEVFSGFSMYLPSKGTEYLNGYYKSLSWNKASGLVK